MTKHDKADQARKGLIDSVKGKVKEVAGAVTGNDSLTAEGQLEQAQAKERKEANSVEALADAEAQRAAEEAREAEREGAEARIDVEARTASAEASIAQQQAAQKRSAEEAARQDVLRADKEAEAKRRRDVALAEAGK